LPPEHPFFAIDTPWLPARARSCRRNWYGECRHRGVRFHPVLDGDQTIGAVGTSRGSRGAVLSQELGHLLSPLFHRRWIARRPVMDDEFTAIRIVGRASDRVIVGQFAKHPDAAFQRPSRIHLADFPFEIENESYLHEPECTVRRWLLQALVTGRGWPARIRSTRTAGKAAPAVAFLRHRVGVFSGRSGEEVDRTGEAGTWLVGLEPEHPRLTRVSSRVESSSVPGMAQPEANRTQHHALTWRTRPRSGDRYRARFRVSVCRPGTVPAWDSQPLWRMPAHLVDNSCHVSTTAAVWCG
jgi:hypothetical protein